MAPPAKSEGAFRTIGEVADLIGVPQHILRYWETRFPQLKPLQRAGNRRYYRPADVALVQRIDRLLNREGYTVRGVQMLLDKGDTVPEAPVVVAPPPSALPPAPHDDLRTIRAMLAHALEDDARPA